MASPTSIPEIKRRVIGIAAAPTGTKVMAVAACDDGAIFVLIPRGILLAAGEVTEPYWVKAPAIPGTLAAIEQEG